MRFERVLTAGHRDAYHGITFEERRSVIRNPDGTAVSDAAVVVPAAWSQTATDIFCHKYCRRAGVPPAVVPVDEDGVPDWLRRSVPAAAGPGPGCESDARHVFRRVVGCWTYWGWKGGYFGPRLAGGHSSGDAVGLDTGAGPPRVDEVSEAGARAFFDELCRALALQMLAPASPQWFNSGLHWAYGITGPSSGHWAFDKSGFFPCDNSYERPASHSCFILSVEDTLLGDGGIMDCATREARIFKYGGGSGSNFSELRGRNEPLSGGGRSSGVLSFLKGLDSFAGAIKSGGTTRRAARMLELDADHPDVFEFVGWKPREEDKVAALVAGSRLNAGHLARIAHAREETPNDERGTRALADAQAAAVRAGVLPATVEREAALAAQGRSHAPAVADTAFEGEAYTTVTAQNANNTVRVTNAFMKAVAEGLPWELYGRVELAEAAAAGVPPRPCRTVDAATLWDRIGEAAWLCADPGVQFHTTVNEWHTCPEDGQIRATNPCQPAFASILTEAGIRRLEEVNVGDVVFTGQGWSEVVHKVSTGVKPVFRYHTRAGSFLGTACHNVFSGGRRVHAGDAETIDVCRGPVAQRNSLVDPQDVLDGLVIGDGTVKRCNYDEAGRHNTYMLLCVGDGDQDYFSSEVACLIKREIFDRKSHAVMTTVREDELPKTYDRTVPDRFYRGSVAVRRGFLRGLYSANGSVSGDRVTLKATSFAVIERVQEMLSSLGICSYYTTNKAKDVDFGDAIYLCRQSYDLNITTDRAAFRDQIGFIQRGKTERLNRACRGQEGNSKKSYEVVRVDDLGEHPVWDVEVKAEEHSYWTGGLLVSNCCEYNWLDDTACNLASLNLVKFSRGPNDFDVATFRHLVRLLEVALDVTVGMAGYPDRKIAEGSYKYRTTGIGYANLGALLMRWGLPYDSAEGRSVAAALTALLHGEATLTSAKLAEELGAFPRYDANRAHCQRVVRNHASAVLGRRFYGLSVEPQTWDAGLCPPTLAFAAVSVTHEMEVAVQKHGLRNAQIDLLAPTGTIGILMDCDTTGVEPDFALVKFKKLAGGGYFKIVNQSLPEALSALGYAAQQIEDVVNYVVGHADFEGLRGHGVTDELNSLFDAAAAAQGRSRKELLGGLMDVRAGLGSASAVDALGLGEETWEVINRHVCGTMTVEGAPHLKDEHLAVFDCANRCGKTGTRYIAPLAHVKMMGAVQPFLSGAISKTINLPKGATVEDVKSLFSASWEFMLKAAAVYRDGSKLCQILTGQADATDSPQETASKLLPRRESLPDRRAGYAQKFRIGQHKFYLHTGEYADGRLGEIFLTSHRDGAQYQALLNQFAIAVSLGLQYGVPLEEYVDAFAFSRFEPSGMVQGHSRLKSGTSVLDVVFRDLAIEYDGREDLAHTAPPEADVAAAKSEPPATRTENARTMGYEGSPCEHCHSWTMLRRGTCLVCDSCGTTTGCA